MSKQACLIVLSSSALGVSATSFLQCYKLTQSAFTLQLATPKGSNAIFVDKDEQSTRWLADMMSKNLLDSKLLQEVNGENYGLVIIPHSPGATEDLSSNEHLGRLLCHCIEHKKPVCAIGLGVSGLLSASYTNGSWPFVDYALTGSTLSEVANTSIFPRLPFLLSDVILDRGGKFSEAAPHSVHVVVNRLIVTGQNAQSTLSAVQNTILLANQRPKS